MKKTPEQLIIDIQMACQELGWQIAMENKDRVNGLLIGNPDYVEETLRELPNGEEYEIWETPMDDSSELH